MNEHAKPASEKEADVSEVAPAKAEKKEEVTDSGSRTAANTADAREAIDPEELTTLKERTIAALSYIGFLAIVPFYLKSESKFCRFHGKQGLLLAILFYFSKLFMVVDLLQDALLILQFVVFVTMGMAALSGHWKKFPWIYDRSCELEKQLSLKE